MIMIKKKLCDHPVELVEQLQVRLTIENQTLEEES